MKFNGPRFLDGIEYSMKIAGVERIGILKEKEKRNETGQ